MALLAYVYDVVLINKPHNGLKMLFGILEEAAKKVGLQINMGKTVINGHEKKK